MILKEDAKVGVALLELGRGSVTDRHWLVKISDTKTGEVIERRYFYSYKSARSYYAAALTAGKQPATRKPSCRWWR